MSATAGTSGLVRVRDTGILVIVVFLAWQVMHQLAGSVALASPAATLVAAYDLILSPDFAGHASATLSAFAIALLISIGGGLLIGLMLGSSRLLGDAGEPALMAFYTVPKVSFFPVILLLFGIGFSAEVAFGVIHGIVPVAIFTMNAVRNVKPVFIKTAHAMGLNRAQIWGTIVLPSAIPEIFTGIRIGLSLTFIGTILSEMFGSRQGIGFLLMNAIGINNGALIMALAVLIIAFALAVSWALLALDNRLHQRV